MSLVRQRPIGIGEQDVDESGYLVARSQESTETNASPSLSGPKTRKERAESESVVKQNVDTSSIQHTYLGLRDLPDYKVLNSDISPSEDKPSDDHDVVSTEHVVLEHSYFEYGDRVSQEKIHSHNESRNTSGTHDDNVGNALSDRYNLRVANVQYGLQAPIPSDQQETFNEPTAPTESVVKQNVDTSSIQHTYFALNDLLENKLLNVDISPSQDKPSDDVETY